MPIEANLIPGERWAFDAEVTDGFDDMLSRSIPQYKVMRGLVSDFAVHFGKLADHQDLIVDLGCSRGGAIAELVEDPRLEHMRFLGVEVSEPMRLAAAARFADNPRVEILGMDLRTDYPARKARVTLAVLTLQFVPMEYRKRIIRQAYLNTPPGGALILVEKVLGETDYLNELLTGRYLRMKADHGYSPDEIDRKRHALEGVLVPVTARWNEDLLRAAGFGEVDCFWRWCCFAGWVAVRSQF